MAGSTIGEAFIKVRPDTAGFSEETESKTSSGLGKVGGMATVAAAGFVALGAASVKAASDDESAQTRLGVAFKNSGQNMGDYQNKIKSTIDTMAKYGFNAADTQDALAKLETATKNPALAMKDLSLAADVAKAKNIDLASATTMVTKASQGNTGALVKAGIISKQQAKDITSGSQALGVLSNAYGGAANAATNTFGGAMAGLKATLTNALSGIGQAILPALSKIIPIIEPVLTQLGGAIAVIFKGLAPILAAVVPIITQVLGVLAGVFGKVLGGIAPIFASVGKAIMPLIPVISQIAIMFSTYLGKALQTLAPLLGMIASTLAGVLGSALKEIIPPVLSLVAALAGPLISIIKTLVPPILDIVKALAGALIPVMAALIPPITMVIGVVGKLMEGIASALAPVLKSLTPVITQLGGVLAMLAGFIGKLLEALLPILPPIAQLLQALLPLLPAVLQIATALLTALMPILQALLPVITAVISIVAQLVAIIVGYLAVAIQALVGWITNLGGTFSSIWGGIKTAVADAWNFIGTYILPLFKDAFYVQVELPLNLLKDAFNTAWNIISSVVQGAWNVISDIFDKIKNGIKDVMGALDKVKNIASGALSTATFGLLASGGPATANAPYIIGEEGPEIFVPNTSGIVIPNSVFSAGASFRSSGLGNSALSSATANTPNTAPIVQTEVNLQIAGVDMANLGAVRTLVDSALDKHTDDVIDAIGART